MEGNLRILINASFSGFAVFVQYPPECSLLCCYVEILLTYHWKAWNTLLNKQCYSISRNGTMITSCVVRIGFFSNVIFEPTTSQWRESEGKRGAHKSFLDIAASLPQTHSLPASLCLSSKLHNPCQSCLDCRLKVIHKQGKKENEGGWREREWMERTIISCAWSSVPRTLMIITSCKLSLASYLFFSLIDAGKVQNGTALWL